MIEMRMGKDDGLEAIGRHLEIPVFPVSLGSSTLERAAIDEIQMSVDIYNVF